MNQEEIGNILKKLRQQKGFTQKDIAKSLIITPQTISKWENGISYPSLDMLVALSELYDVSVDDLVKGEIENDVSVIKEDSNIMYQVMVYVFLGILLGLGIATIYVDYANMIFYYNQINEYSFDYYPEPIFSILENAEWSLLTVMIVTPIVITFTNLLDKSKIIPFIISLVSLSFLSFKLTKFISHYEFHEPKLGVIFVMMYLLVLIGMMSLLVLTSSTNLKEKLIENKTKLISAISIFVITFALPFTYIEVFYQNQHGWNVSNYYEQFDQVLILGLYATSSLLVLSSFESIKKTVTIIKIAMITAMLWATIVYIFNSGLYNTSLLLYLTIIILGITFQKGDLRLFSISNIKGVSLTVVELVSISFVLYLITLDGDLFFGEHPVTGYHHSIRFQDLGYGSLYTLSFILIAVSMFLRFTKLIWASRGIYIIWFVGQILVYIDLNNRYIETGYQMTDGMFFFFPPIMIGFYFLVLIGYNIRQKLTLKS